MHYNIHAKSGTNYARNPIQLVGKKKKNKKKEPLIRKTNRNNKCLHKIQLKKYNSDYYNIQ